MSHIYLSLSVCAVQICESERCVGTLSIGTQFMHIALF